MAATDDSVPNTPDEVQPIAMTGDRIASLDFIRGVAVMGILAANIISMGQPATAHPYPAAFATDHSAAEEWMWVAQLVLIDNKMRGLFTILFGAGLYLFVEKAWARGASRMLQVRRLFWLGLFGLLHFYFVWQGDILFAYAFSGLLAVLFLLDLAPRHQIVLGLLGYLAGGIFYGVSLIFMQSVADSPDPDSAALADVRAQFLEAAESDLDEGRLETGLWQDGSYFDLVSHVFAEHGAEPFEVVFSFAFETLPLILIGMAFYRLGLFSGAFSARVLLRWGLALGMVGGFATLWVALETKAAGLTYYGTMAALVGWSHFPSLLMTAGYLAILVALAPATGSWFGERISAAGRAAFTNYLGTSVVMLFVFGNWGLDLFGRLGRSELYVVTLFAWAIMLAWSKPWLGRFRYGPLEWLWRCLTYGKVFALRRQ